MYIDKIIDLLTKYVDEYEEKIEKFKTYETNISLFKELIPLLKVDYNFLEENKLFITVLLSSIYSSDIELDFYNALYALKNGDSAPFYAFFNKINNDMKKNITKKTELYKQTKNIENLVKSAKSSLIFLKSKLTLKTSNILNIKKIIAYYVGMGLIDTKEELLLANDLYYYNKGVNATLGTSFFKDEYESVPNILNGGFEIFDEVDINPQRKEVISDYLKEIKTFIRDIPNNEIISSLEKYQKFGIDNNEYNYIINEIIKALIYDLLDYYNLLLDPSMFQKNETRNEIIKNYYSLLNKYTILRNYYHELTDVFEEDIVVQNSEFNENVLVFSHPSNKPTEARFIQDLKNVPFEYYEEVLNLVNSFAKNNIRLKKITNNKNLKNAFELKRDQIRIILTHIKDNVFCILGVFAKKADNDRKNYESIFNRSVVDVKSQDKLDKETQLGKITLSKLEELTIEKGRKGNR